NDSDVKFVPFGYKTETQTPNELEKNSYIIARYGKEGAEKMAEVSSKYKVNPYLFSFKSVDEERQRMSALISNWYGGRLDVDGDVWDGGGGGHSFGVSVAD
ncbi:hypothetical protein J4412_00590, partial [Candidatus Pacearchaeota archaeon]|nr:hypothetical protein [Candidatus Pacearchaeota archaeon]